MTVVYSSKTKRSNTMSFKFVSPMPSPEAVKDRIPMTASLQKIKADRDQMIKDVFTGVSDKFLVIIGPCSADNEDSVLEYNERLAKLQDKVSDRLILIPRIYTNKPRTTGLGYKGIVHQPDPEGKVDMEAGILAMRQMHIHSIEQTGLTSADEMLYPENWSFVDDFLSYVAIGARSVENQQHRLTVSGIDIPAGMKNPTSGDYSVMLNSCIAAQSSHTFTYRNAAYETSGNPLAHCVLRGATNKHGDSIPNYHFEDLELVFDKYEETSLLNPTVIVDTNHSNSGKKYEQQPRIAHEILNSRRYDPRIKKLVKGLMIESYLEPGAQKIGAINHVYGKSITDPCLGWDASERLVYEIAALA
ncbi:MAG: 3-deoxy-7-phosphoheptulonate synthase [Eubacteriales bacterium]|nr:3-deoxy-7-phosphoheptulonate synthase [Eubacteriales bacterium]